MEYLAVLFVAIYFILGFGVYKMWKLIFDDDWAFFLILMWPIILITAALTNQE